MKYLILWRRCLSILPAVVFHIGTQRPEIITPQQLSLLMFITWLSLPIFVGRALLKGWRRVLERTLDWKEM
jgi:hypothetical protein